LCYKAYMSRKAVYDAQLSELRDALDIDGLKRRAYHAYNEEGLCIDPLGLADVGLWGVTLRRFVQKYPKITDVGVDG